MDSVVRFQYEIRYTRATPSPEHESWLTEWSLDWIELEEVRRVVVDRTLGDEAATQHIVIEFTPLDPGTIELESHRRLFEAFTDEVGTFSLDCSRASTQ